MRRLRFSGGRSARNLDRSSGAIASSSRNWVIGDGAREGKGGAIARFVAVRAGRFVAASANPGPRTSRTKLRSIAPRQGRRSAPVPGAATSLLGTVFEHADALVLREWGRPRRCTLHGSLASPAGRKKIAHRFIGGYRPWREASPARDGRVLSSLTGLGPRLTWYPRSEEH